MKNFDIRKEANGVTSQTVQKEFKAQVSENYLDIHLFWAGKGTTSIPTQGTYGPTVSAISATPGNSGDLGGSFFLRLCYVIDY